MRSYLLHIIFFLLATGLVRTSVAQLEPQFTQFMMNRMIFNPAQAGSEQAIVATGVFRSKWTGFEGQPVSKVLSTHAPIGDLRSGVGLHVINDQIGALQNTSFMLTYSYRQAFSFGELSAGISGGAMQHGLDGTILQTPDGNYQNGSLDHNDNNVPQGSVNGITPNFNVGLFFTRDEMYVGLSSTNVLEPTLHYQSNNQFARNDLIRHYFLTAGYQVTLNSNFTLIPAVLVKMDESDAMKGQMDLNANLVYADQLLFGLAYRSLTRFDRDGMAAIAGMHITDKMYLGYSYDLSFSAFQTHTAGTHEVLLSYRFGLLQEGQKTKVIYTPRFL